MVNSDNRPDAVESDAPVAAQADRSASEAAPKRSRSKNMKVIVGVICAVVIVAGAGFWVWHEQPSFCNAICHAPQDPINATYDGQPGQAGYDKWGNPVADMGTLMVVSHKNEGATCLSCHEPTIGQQITEGMHWVSGSFEYPLNERSLTDLNHYLQKDDPAEFCLNEGCHNITREELAEKTADLGERNPHITEARHEAFECSDCHKSHRQSVQSCTRCHDDASVPDGWLTASEAAALGSNA